MKDFLSVSFPGLRIIDWKWDFRSGRTIVGEIEEAARNVKAALFLVTRDDILQDPRSRGLAAPRDNVVFEIGYFAARLGIERTILVVEAAARMPSDLGGVLVIPLEDRDDTRTIETQLSIALGNALRAQS
jgi:predicted nucleotide-binding protein